MVVKLVPFAAYGRFANECDTLEAEEIRRRNRLRQIKSSTESILLFEVKGESMDDGTRNSFEEAEIEFLFVKLLR